MSVNCEVQRFSYVWNLAGTFQLKEKKYSQKKFTIIKNKHDQLIDRYNKRWQIQFHGLKEEWQKDGSWVSIVSLPAGLQMELIEKLNKLTHGRVQIKPLKS